jgi:hypothetical protein
MTGEISFHKSWQQSAPRQTQSLTVLRVLCAVVTRASEKPTRRPRDLILIRLN